MPIPELNDDGFLPPGVHTCTLDEVKARFGSFRESDRRPRLFSRLVELFRELQRSNFFIAMVINGSFTTGEPLPNDIDIILVLHRNHDKTADLSPADYALMNRSAGRRFGFDLLIAREGSLEYEEYVGFFAQVRRDRRRGKGMLRVNL